RGRHLLPRGCAQSEAGDFTVRYPKAVTTPPTKPRRFNLFWANMSCLRFGSRTRNLDRIDLGAQHAWRRAFVSFAHASLRQLTLLRPPHRVRCCANTTPEIR